MRRPFAAGAAALALVSLPAFAAGGASALPRVGVLPHVTLIGDSVATAITGDTDAKAVIEQGATVDLEAQSCRRLEDPSCPPNPPTALQVIASLGSQIGPTVVIAVGYDDFETRYAAEIEDTLAALHGAGVTRVFWLTLRAVRHPYLTMNDDIAAAAANHPEVTVIDWNAYSRSHPDWFQSDGLHLLAGGAMGMATLIHQQLLAAHIAVTPVVVTTKSLPVARKGRTFGARLAASGGVAPYAWSLTGRLPAGLHLRPTGMLFGDARSAPGTFRFVVRAQDADGQTGTRPLVLHLR